MKSKLTKVLLASSLALACLTPAFANQTTVQINADIEEVLILQLEETGGTIVSGDEFELTPGFTFTNNEVFEFGTVDPYGVSAGAFNPINNVNPTGTFDHQLFVGANFEDETTYDLTGMSATDGAVYYVQGGYQLRALRTGALPMDVDADVDLGSEMDALIAPTVGGNTFAAGDPIVGRRCLPDNSTGCYVAPAPGVANLFTLQHNVPQGIDIGVFVPINIDISTSTAKTTSVTFWGT
jgi:hypothetical protein